MLTKPTIKLLGDLLSQIHIMPLAKDAVGQTQAIQQAMAELQAEAQPKGELIDQLRKEDNG